MIRLGGPVFDSTDDPVKLAAAHKSLGYTAAYAPQVDLNDSSRIAAVRAAFKAQNIVIAEVGAWCNLVAVEPERRKSNREFVSSRLALADELGACCCVDYLGTLAPDSNYGPAEQNLAPETFDLAVDTVRTVIDAVQPRRAKFSLEMMQWIIPDSVDSYLRLIKAVDRPSFGVHLDPVNIITSPRAYYDTGSLIRDCFSRLGKWIVSCHAKDIVLRGELAMHFDEVRPGLGNLDYAAYLRELVRLPGSPPLMLEHLSSPDEYSLAHDFLCSVLRTVEAEKQ